MGDPRLGVRDGAVGHNRHAISNQFLVSYRPISNQFLVSYRPISNQFLVSYGAVGDLSGAPRGACSRTHPRTTLKAMSYPYWLVLLLGLDRFLAAALFNCPDMCVSSLCWVALVEIRWPPYCIYREDMIIAEDALRMLKLSPFQLAILARLGRTLEQIQPGHCRKSARDDGIQAARTYTLVTGVVQPKHLL